MAAVSDIPIVFSRWADAAAAAANDDDADEGRGAAIDKGIPASRPPPLHPACRSGDAIPLLSSAVAVADAAAEKKKRNLHNWPKKEGEGDERGRGRLDT